MTPLLVVKLFIHRHKRQKPFSAFMDTWPKPSTMADTQAIVCFPSLEQPQTQHFFGICLQEVELRSYLPLKYKGS